MFDFPNLNTPPREKVSREAKAALASAFENLMDEMLRSMEENASDERTRAQAGLCRRHSDVKNAMSKMLNFADPTRPASVETIKAANVVMDQVLTELTAFLNDNPIPEKEISENDKI